MSSITTKAYHLFRIPGVSSQYWFDLFSKPLVALGTSFVVQNTFKFFLTQGDGLLMATLGSLSDLGSYTLASNYGGLIARMLFQPIEESTRNMFAQLCSFPEPDSKTSKATKEKNKPSGVNEAKSLLVFILRLYSIVGAVAFGIGPAIAPVLLRLVAGNKWADTEASTVLSVYCYYIPLLAVNGVTEGFVASVATETELATQSVFMVICFTIFSGLAYFLVKMMSLGAVGLVYANSVNMLLRIAFNHWFNGRFFRKHGEASTTTEGLIS
jgi:hypothetical protein